MHCEIMEDAYDVGGARFPPSTVVAITKLLVSPLIMPILVPYIIP